jgi:phosphoglycerate dehydrogenase-like enzyme
MRRTPDEEERTEAEYCSLNRLLRTSDFVTVRAPLTKKTHHMIDERRLRLMKSTALLINTSRGPLVNESALITALTERWIAGTGLDVFEMEPIRENNPLLRLNNVVLLPHIGGATHKARSKMAEIVAENVLAALHGRQPKGGLPHMTLGAVNNGLGSCWMGTTPPQDAHQADEAAG